MAAIRSPGEGTQLPPLDAFRVRLQDAYLVHARFLDKVRPYKAVPVLPDELAVDMSVSFARGSLRELTVALGVTVPLNTPYVVEAMYAAAFVLSDDIAEADVEEHWKQTATRLAPLVLYPFLREVVSDLTRRSKAEPITLPILSFRAFEETPVEIPPPPGTGSSDQLVL